MNREGPRRPPVWVAALAPDVSGASGSPEPRRHLEARTSDDPAGGSRPGSSMKPRWSLEWGLERPGAGLVQWEWDANLSRERIARSTASRRSSYFSRCRWTSRLRASDSAEVEPRGRSACVIGPVAAGRRGAQRLILLLGDRTRALGFTLSPRTLAAAIFAAWEVVPSTWLARLFHYGFVVRAVVGVMAVAIRGFSMGFLFPLGLRRMQPLAQRGALWCWGVTERCWSPLRCGGVPVCGLGNLGDAGRRCGGVARIAAVGAALGPREGSATA